MYPVLTSENFNSNRQKKVAKLLFFCQKRFIQNEPAEYEILRLYELIWVVFIVSKIDKTLPNEKMTMFLFPPTE